MLVGVAMIFFVFWASMLQLSLMDVEIENGQVNVLLSRRPLYTESLAGES
jgi:hypothetical protein